MGIPYARDYHATAEGSVVKEETCEKCRRKYAYLMHRQAGGTGTSWFFVDNDGAQRRAEMSAQHELQRKLVEGCEPVPCPYCGWYQKNMVGYLKRRHQLWILMLSGGVLLLAALVGVLAGLLTWSPLAGDMLEVVGAWAAAGVLSVIAFGLAVLWFLLAAAYEPNQTDEEERIYLGKSRALRADDVDFYRQESLRSGKRKKR